MNLKEFLKSLSIYGILPVFTKFAGFLLVPIYVRVLSQYDYGVVELIVSTISFATYLISMELYAAIGRFYFDRDSVHQKQKLISTGLFLTLLSSALVSILYILFQNLIHQALFKSGSYFFELRLGLAWAVISAISTYLSILPRYEKKARRFVLFNIITVSVKLSSTIFFVVVLRLGIKGVLLGHIAGACTSTILYSVSSLKYLRWIFSINEVKEMFHFSLPLVPGVFLLGIYQPLMRTLISKVYDVNSLAIFSFAYKMTMLMAIVETGIRLAWRPMLYENIKSKSFGKEYSRISEFSASILLVLGVFVISVSKEIVTIIGTVEYYDSVQIIGFLVIGTILWNLDSLRGFGFELAKKTYLITTVNTFSRLVGVLFMLFVAPKLGLMGIGIAMMLPQFIDYSVKVIYTKRLVDSQSMNGSEILLWGLVIVSVILSILNANILLRVSTILVSVTILISLYHSEGRRILQSVIRRYD